MADKLPFSSFDTKGLPLQAARTLWFENIDVLFDVNVVIGKSRSLAQSFERSRYRAARDGLSQYLIQFYSAGLCGKRGSAESEWARPGDLMLVDLAQPLATAATDFANLTMIVPRGRLAPRLSAPDAQHMRIIRREEPMVGVLERHLISLLQAGPQMTRAQGEVLVQPTLDMVAAVLNAGDRRDLDVPGVRASLQGEIRRYLQTELDNPALDPQTVAARFGISRRKLYYLFEAEGGFVSYLQGLRLDAVRAALIDPTQKERSISEIASQYCFGSRSGFIAAFRRNYGLVPREARALGRERWPGNRPSPLHAVWRGWIDNLR